MSDIIWTAFNNYKTKNSQWLEIDEDYFDHLLNVLPPIFLDNNSFLSSEPFSHTEEGAAIYITAKKEGDSYYAKLATRIEYQEEFRRIKS